MNSVEVLRGILSFLAGFGLGFLNFRWYEKSLVGILEGGRIEAVRKQVARAGIFRHVFIFFGRNYLAMGRRVPPDPPLWWPPGLRFCLSMAIVETDEPVGRRK